MVSDEIKLTVVTAEDPPVLSKTFRLGESGEIVKLSGGKLYRGAGEVKRVSGIGELANLLESLNPRQALTYGIPQSNTVRIIPQKELSSVKKNGGPPIVSRTRENWRWPDGGAVLMVDTDGSIPSDRVREILYEVLPELRQCPFLMRPSASSSIYKTGEKDPLRGVTGLRTLIPVKSGLDIARAAKVLENRLWLAGEGYIAVSKSGALLPRLTILDASVYQPERLDFLGGAHCHDGLEQRLPKCKLFNENGKILDTAVALPDDRAAENRARAIIAKAKLAAAGEAAQARAAWIETRLDEYISKNPGVTPEDTAKLKSIYRGAVESKRLLGDFEIQLHEGRVVTVSQILDDRSQFDGVNCADPLEPDYRGDRRIAKINAKATGAAWIYSHAHGGVKYMLTRSREQVTLRAGELVDAAASVLQALGIHSSVFQRGKALVKVDVDGEIHMLDAPGVQALSNEVVAFEKYDSRSKRLVSCDCPSSVAQTVLSARWRWNLPELRSVVVNPVYDPFSDRVIDEEGFDPATKLYLSLGDLSGWAGVKERPGRDDVLKALDVLFKPFLGFPFKSGQDIGALLSTLFSASIRPLLRTCPGTAFRSPAAGTGKTKLAECCAILAGSLYPQVQAVPGEQTEMKKVLFAHALAGQPAMIFDNINGKLSSDALCSFLTSPDYTDRVLGQSEIVPVPTAAVVLLTGNNLHISGDLCRRVLICEIDAGVEKPWKRSFLLEPVSYCREHRLEILAAIYTVLRAARQAGARCPDRTGSFEDWSDYVRSAVIWLKNFEELEVEDPVTSIDLSVEEDPEKMKLGELLCAWSEFYGDDPVSAQKVVRDAEGAPGDSGFRDAVAAVAGTRGGRLEARLLGYWLRANQKVIVDGLSFKKTNKKGHDNQTAWQVEKC